LDVNAPEAQPGVQLSCGIGERRERQPVQLSGHAVRENGSTAKITVIDLSYDGCGVECGVELRPDESIKLLVSGRGHIDAQVRWSAAGRAGLVFDAGPPPVKNERPRRSERILTAGEVSFRRRGKLSSSVHVFDASPHGCKVELDERLELDEHVWVRFDGLQPLEAQVSWLEGSSAGLRFFTPIHPAVFDLLSQKIRV
jgi:hypothetical protein